MRDYRLLVLSCDDVLRRQAELDVASLEDARRHPFSPQDRTPILRAQVVAQRQTFLSSGIGNAAFIYAMRALGPSAPVMLTRIAATLSSR